MITTMDNQRAVRTCLGEFGACFSFTNSVARKDLLVMHYRGAGTQAAAVPLDHLYWYSSF